MPDYKDNPLSKFNTDAVLGKGFGGEENRNPKQISLTAKGPYNVEQLCYPEDITKAPDLQHYMVFYINVRQKTKFKPTNVVNVDVSSRGQNRGSAETRQTTGQAQFTQAGAIAGAAGLKNLFEKSGLGQAAQTAALGALARSGPKGAAAAGIITRFTSGNATTSSSVLGGVAGAAAAGAAIGIATELRQTLQIDIPRRITEAIVLPIDSIPSVKYSMKYDTYEMGALGGLLGGSSAVDAAKLDRTGEFAVRSILSIADAAKAAGLGNIKENILTAAAVQVNPFKEVFFEAINFRTFTFAYTFLPKSEKEVYNVKRIIDMFKFHMHPELSSGSLFYVYPSEFDISYYYKGLENEFVHKISTCVLTDMGVEYGGQYFVSFENGAPAEIKMTLTFRELELLTKERILKGY